MTSSQVTNGTEGPGLDENVLRRLFDLAGPDQSAEILDRLVVDLRCMMQGIERTRQDDVIALRRHVHALIGIAGTVGARHLHAQALAAGRHLREGTGGDPAEIVMALVPMTTTLVARLVEMRAERRG